MTRFGVVIPTKNSLKYLPDHLKNLATWIELAEQVVVVDSFSKDGTVEFIKKTLRHPNLRFVDHPPGLYASWNHGIRQLTTEYCYISTVGDSLTRAGAEHLVATAARLQCDVLVSRPNFVTETDEPYVGPDWPMNDVINTLQLREPTLLPAAIIVVTALTHTGGAITGSCASDLFRTAVLQEFPFPTDYGVSGDGAWSLQNAGRLKWAVTLEKFTTFRRHPTAASIEETQRDETVSKFPENASRMVAHWQANLPVGFPDRITVKVKKLLAVAIELEQCRRRHNLHRKSKWPWSLNPRAWQMRARRNQLQVQARRLMAQVCFENHRQ
jgi:hypothetical protein